MNQKSAMLSSSNIVADSPVLAGIKFLILAILSGPLLAQDTQDARGSALKASKNAAEVVAAIESATKIAIAKAEKSVVAISRVPSNKRASNRAFLAPMNLSLDTDFDDPAADPDFVPNYFGTGVILSEDGFIVTCAHLLGDPSENDYHVWHQGQHFRAKRIASPKRGTVYASDPFSDLAILKIPTAGLIPIEFAAETSLEKGQFVVALGNPDAIARDGRVSATWGMVSNIKRVAPTRKETEEGTKQSVHQYGTLIQTHLRQSLGSSGGALVDLEGRMLGLTTSLVARPGNVEDAGFAIATDDFFKRVVESLKQGKLPEYGFLGIQPAELRWADQKRGLRGARVGVVIPGLPGDTAKVQANDIVTAVNGVAIGNRNDLFRELSFALAGETVLLSILRPAGRTTKELELQARVSKKPLQQLQNAYSLHSDQGWNGMIVDYSSAVLTDASLLGTWGIGKLTPKIAVLEVAPDTAAWQAGIRPGNGILRVGDLEVDSPNTFYRAAENATRVNSESVILSILNQDGILRKLTVSPANPELTSQPR
ncbi:MAG: trypsin-like peptidase domain-containing protein [Pirellulaceae bacterium]